MLSRTKEQWMHDCRVARYWTDKARAILAGGQKVPAGPAQASLAGIPPLSPTGPVPPYASSIYRGNQLVRADGGTEAGVARRDAATRGRLETEGFDPYFLWDE